VRYSDSRCAQATRWQRAAGRQARRYTAPRATTAERRSSAIAADVADDVAVRCRSPRDYAPAARVTPQPARWCRGETALKGRQRRYNAPCAPRLQGSIATAAKQCRWQTGADNGNAVQQQRAQYSAAMQALRYVLRGVIATGAQQRTDPRERHGVAANGSRRTVTKPPIPSIDFPARRRQAQQQQNRAFRGSGSKTARHEARGRKRGMQEALCVSVKERVRYAFFAFFFMPRWPDAIIAFAMFRCRHAIRFMP